MRIYPPCAHQPPLIPARLLLSLLVLLTISLTANAQIRGDGCDAFRELLKAKPPGDQKAGSVLFFAKYTSDTIDPQREDSRINITNTHPMNDIDVHLYFVDGSSCSIADAQMTLTPNQTVSFLSSDLDPGVVGYLVAVANYSGVPTQFNFLMGDVYIHELSGLTTMLPAMAIEKVSGGDLMVTPESTADLVFDGTQYERLPQTVAVSSFNSQAADETVLALFIPTTNLGIGTNESTSIFTLLYDDTERVRSTSFLIRCYRRLPLSSLRVIDGLNNFVREGHTGWIKMTTMNDRPILGASFTRGLRFSGALNFKHISLLNTYTITVPVF